MNKRTKVYIAGPYTNGDVGENVHNACIAWTILWRKGYVPYCPHWTHFQHTLHPMDKNEWLDFDDEWLPLCNVVLRLPGPSHGADAEIELAKEHNIPVVYSVEELLELFPL